MEPLNSIPGRGLIWVNKKPWFEKARILPSACLFSQQGPKLAVCAGSNNLPLREGKGELERSPGLRGPFLPRGLTGAHIGKMLDRVLGC